MHKGILRSVVFACVLPLAAASPGAAQGMPPAIDVISYELQLEPDLAARSLAGTERIEFEVTAAGLTTARFEAGPLLVEDVRLDGRVVPHRRLETSLVLDFSPPLAAGRHALTLAYHGTPRRGVSFYPDSEQIYTVFSTSQWMVCIDEPSERARFAIDLRVPASWDTVANGRELDPVRESDGRLTRRFRLDREAPSYTYGFAAGAFRRITDGSARVPLITAAPRAWSDEEARRVLRETAEMFHYFEDRAGVPYPDDAYLQVLADGNPQQEMSGFSVLPAAWGRRVLAGESDVVLAAHELAHQWWGNLVTNADWTHFWLNEGMATFMAAAYVEARSGRAAYEALMGAYRESYEQVRAAGHDKPLEFDNWSRPSADDRTLVYRKGAYVLHLLRIELGDERFWAGLKAYTQRCAGHPVVSADFQAAMEQSSGRDLSAFFARWVRRG